VGEGGDGGGRADVASRSCDTWSGHALGASGSTRHASGIGCRRYGVAVAGDAPSAGLVRSLPRTPPHLAVWWVYGGTQWDAGDERHDVLVAVFSRGFRPGATSYAIQEGDD